MTISSPSRTVIPRSGLLLKPMNSGFFSRTPGALITKEATLLSGVSSTMSPWSKTCPSRTMPWSVSSRTPSFFCRSRKAMAGVAALHTLTSRREGLPKSGESWGMGLEVKAKSGRS